MLVPKGESFISKNFIEFVTISRHPQNSSHYHCVRCHETVKNIIDLPKHECRSVIHPQSKNVAYSSDLLVMQNKNNEKINGNAVGQDARDCDDAMDSTTGDLSGTFTDSCGSEKMNATEGKIGSHCDDKDKVSGRTKLFQFWSKTS